MVQAPVHDPQDRAYNTHAEGAETYPRHRPQPDPAYTGAPVCGWRDELGRRCGRWLNWFEPGAQRASQPGAWRHNPPMGVPHPRYSSR